MAAMPSARRRAGLHWQQQGSARANLKPPLLSPTSKSVVTGSESAGATEGLPGATEGLPGHRDGALGLWSLEVCLGLSGKKLWAGGERGKMEDMC